MAFLNAIRGAFFSKLTPVLSLGGLLGRGANKSMGTTASLILKGTSHNANTVGNYFYENDRSVNQVISGHQDFMQGALGLIGAPTKGTKVA